MRRFAWLLAAVLVAGCAAGKPAPAPAPQGGAPAPAPSEGPAPEPQTPAAEPEQPAKEPPPLPKTPAEVEKVLGVWSQEAIQALKARDMGKLMAMSHPHKGIRFSPYPYVNVEKDLVFHSENSGAPGKTSGCTCGARMPAAGSPSTWGSGTTLTASSTMLTSPTPRRWAGTSRSERAR
ncbi:MAG TPA: hypothetical protein VD969_19055 [Symbiobacteriaceae bacterium]|nr:hypothetical protein [Symbiobacteriaceae bacterium]